MNDELYLECASGDENYALINISPDKKYADISLISADGYFSVDVVLNKGGITKLIRKLEKISQEIE